MMRRRYLILAATVLAGAGTAGQMRAPEWPQYLGPSRNSTSAVTIPASASLSVAWKKPAPGGAAGIVVAGDRAYTLGSDGEQDYLLAYEIATGTESWRVALSPTHADSAMGPASTPVIAGDLIIAIPTSCRMQAVNRTTRAVAWTLDFGEQFKTPAAKRGGCGMTPLLAGDRVIFPTGSPDGRLAAVDAASGRLLWRADVLPSFGGAPGWMSEGHGVVLYHHVKQDPQASGVTALDPQSGKVVWQIEGAGGASGVPPVPLGPGRLLVERWPHVSVYDTATRQPVWSSPEIVALDHPAVVHNGHIYTFGGQGGEYMTCVDASNGRVKWTSRIYRAHLALAGDTIVAVSHAAGMLRLIAADPTAYRELATVNVLKPGARTGTPPTIVNGKVLLRNYEEVVAVSIAAK